MQDYLADFRQLAAADRISALAHLRTQAELESQTMWIPGDECGEISEEFNPEQCMVAREKFLGVMHDLLGEHSSLMELTVPDLEISLRFTEQLAHEEILKLWRQPEDRRVVLQTFKIQVSSALAQKS